MDYNERHSFPNEALSREESWLTFLLFGHAGFQYLYAGCELGLFDLLHRNPCLSSEEIQKELDLQSHPARGLLFGLSSLRLLELSHSRYSNSEAVTKMIIGGDWDVFKATVRFEGEIVYIGQTDFVESLRQNSNVGLRRFAGEGQDLYFRLSEDPRVQNIFYDYMGSWSKLAIKKLVQSVDFSGIRRILDIGGGDATNAIFLAAKFPELCVTVLDIPSNSDVPRRKIEAAGLQKRVNVLEGNMFKAPFPTGYDCLMFIHQLVIWPAEKNRELLTKAYASLPKGGKVIIFSSISDDNESGPVMTAMDSAYFLSIPSPGGLIYPWKDYERWLTDAGFKDIRRYRCNSWTPHGAIVAQKN